MIVKSCRKGNSLFRRRSAHRVDEAAPLSKLACPNAASVKPIMAVENIAMFLAVERTNRVDFGFMMQPPLLQQLRPDLGFAGSGY